MPARQIHLFLLFVLISLPALAQLSLPDLPEPVSNNAVAVMNTSEGKYLLSFMGLGPGKTHKDVHNKVWSLKPGDKHWQQRKPVPSSLPLKGRLASIAVAIKDKAYIFGGYTVAEDHSEISSPDNFVYDVLSDSYKSIAPTPVAVDDAVALVYQQRYIYLISGWHDDGNVNLVQLYDSQTNRWQQASPFPGVPVFGHAGGIVDRQMLICDGVKVHVRQKQRRTFLPEAACYTGIIDPKKPNKIDWRLVPHPTGKARYRMAAGSISMPATGIVFIGGSLNPYNYDGMGYDGNASTPDNKLWYYNFSQQQWQIRTINTTTMDHRGLLRLDDNTLVILGGMQDQQKVSDKVTIITIPILRH
jgi:N-acetylneuraminic acid mutarotase